MKSAIENPARTVDASEMPSPNAASNPPTPAVDITDVEGQPAAEPFTISSFFRNVGVSFTISFLLYSVPLITTIVLTFCYPDAGGPRFASYIKFMLTLWYLIVISPCAICMLMVFAVRLANGGLQPGSKAFYSALRSGFVMFSGQLFFWFLITVLHYRNVRARQAS